LQTALHNHAPHPSRQAADLDGDVYLLRGMSG
jgi:hypothetical protein